MPHIGCLRGSVFAWSFIAAAVGFPSQVTAAHSPLPAVAVQEAAAAARPDDKSSSSSSPVALKVPAASSQHSSVLRGMQWDAVMKKAHATLCLGGFACQSTSSSSVGMTACKLAIVRGQ